VVTNLDIDEKVAYVEKSEVNFYTTPADQTKILVEREQESRFLLLSAISVPDPQPLTPITHFGDVVVSNQVTHYWRKRLFSDEIIEKRPLDLPETQLHTEAVWFALPDEVTNKIIGRGFDLAGTIHAIEHAAIGLLPLFALCDRQDIGGVSHQNHPDTDGTPVIFIYDGHAGGVGLARTAYERIEDLLSATLTTIRDCQCDDGCPSCIQSPKCGNNNEPLDKAGAVFALSEILRIQ
jgi:DEAD/DEAH box helicase domain-containing protein